MAMSITAASTVPEAGTSRGAVDCPATFRIDAHQAEQPIMDQAVTETLPLAAIAAVIGGVFLFATLMMWIQGWALRCAVRICGGESIGIIYSVTVVVVSGAAGALGSAIVMIAAPETGPWGSLGAGVGAAVVALCLLLRMDPLRAFGVYVVNTVLSAIAIFSLVIVAAVALFFAVPRSTLDSLASTAQQRLGDERLDQLGWSLSTDSLITREAQDPEPRSSLWSESVSPASAPGTGSAGDIQQNLRKILDRTLYAEEVGESDESTSEVPRPAEPQYGPGFQRNPFVP